MLLERLHVSGKPVGMQDCERLVIPLHYLNFIFQFFLQVVLSVRAGHPAQPVQHVCELPAHPSGHHRKRAKVGAATPFLASRVIWWQRNL